MIVLSLAGNWLCLIILALVLLKAVTIIFLEVYAIYQSPGTNTPVLQAPFWLQVGPVLFFQNLSTLFLSTQI